MGRPVWTPRDYTAFAREGFQQNAVVHRCVRMIAEAAAGVPLLLFEGERESGVSSTRHRSGENSGWTTLSQAEAGGASSEIAKGSDGALIRHEKDPGSERGWTERTVVALPGGSIQFLTDGDAQVVATMDGQTISRPNGRRMGRTRLHPSNLPSCQRSFPPRNWPSKRRSSRSAGCRCGIHQKKAGRRFLSCVPNGRNGTCS